ncbi:tetratricopeptide repeat protein [Hugenholtzia roseola]|uniref:tetratricopeptide repeat protein n=1 Tax=Hugenholtzia roseola TaxID=1002 RepID=UPI0012B54AC8|nr:hypothetical protein [Hugenholtzia roseola]
MRTKPTFGHKFEQIFGHKFGNKFGYQNGKKPYLFLRFVLYFSILFFSLACQESTNQMQNASATATDSTYTPIFEEKALDHLSELQEKTVAAPSLLQQELALQKKIDSLETRLLPKKYKDLWIKPQIIEGSEAENPTYQLILYASLAEGGEEILQEIKLNYAFNASKITHCVYRAGKIWICSQEAYSANTNCGIYEINKKSLKLIYQNQVDYDPAKSALQAARQAAISGEIEKSVFLYDKVIYPQNYMNPKDEALRLLHNAHLKAQDFYEQGRYDSAVQTIEAFFGFWGAGYLKKFEDEAHFLATFESPNSRLQAIQVQRMLSDYGLYLLKAGRYRDALAWNTYVFSFSATIPFAVLRLADTHHEREELEKAKFYYQEYIKIATEKKESVPDYVRQRLQSYESLPKSLSKGTY